MLNFDQQLGLKENIFSVLNGSKHVLIYEQPHEIRRNFLYEEQWELSIILLWKNSKCTKKHRKISEIDLYSMPSVSNNHHLKLSLHLTYREGSVTELQRSSE